MNAPAATTTDRDPFGPSGNSEDLRITDRDIELVARRMCLRLGLDPDAHVQLERPQVTRASRLRPSNVYCLPGPVLVDAAGQIQKFNIPMIQLADPPQYGFQWQMFSRDAEIALAAHYAVQDWMLLR